MILISVVIPLYNSRNYICQAVDSALAQVEGLKRLQDTGKISEKVSLEIIVVDDCSNDGGQIILENHLIENDFDVTNKYGNNRVCQLESTDGIVVEINRLEENSGVATARNYGVTRANGEYVAFLDSDDMWVDGKLAKQYQLLQKTGADLCNTARQMMESDGTVLEHMIPTPKNITLEKLEHSNYINCSSVLVKKDVIAKYPMEHSDAHEDYFAWLRMLQDGVKMVGINEPLLLYRLVDTGKSRNKFKSAKMHYKTYRYAGYSATKASKLMMFYILNGLKKYKGIKKI